ncbi:MAG: hypothetical protein H0T46_34625 [Deltaproteobacteria bacterium]|nr:hypothetical protein [Deltaproteobacteria bacterium]
MLIVGCSSGGAPDRFTPPTPPAVATAPEAPLDALDQVSAPVDAPQDAFITDGAVVLVRRIDPCKLPPSPENPRCNPPAPTAVIGRVMALKKDGDDLVIDVGRGARDGVEKRWQAEFVNDSGASLPLKATFEVLSVALATTKLRVRGVRKLPDSHSVRLYPP